MAESKTNGNGGPQITINIDDKKVIDALQIQRNDAFNVAAQWKAALDEAVRQLEELSPKVPALMAMVQDLNKKNLELQAELDALKPPVADPAPPSDDPPGEATATTT